MRITSSDCWRVRRLSPACQAGLGTIFALALLFVYSQPVGAYDNHDARRESARAQPDAGLNDSDDLVPEQYKPAEKKKLLAKLYKKLKKAAGEDATQPIVDAIERLWLSSGNDTIDYLMQNAVSALDEKDLKVAQEILDRVVELEPDYAEGWNKRAVVAYLEEDYVKSLRNLRHVLALDPNHFRAVNGLALVLQKIGDKKAALAAFRELLKIHPNNETARRSVEELEREVEGQPI